MIWNKQTYALYPNHLNNGAYSMFRQSQSVLLWSQSYRLDKRRTKERTNQRTILFTFLVLLFSALIIYLRICIRIPYIIVFHLSLSLSRYVSPRCIAKYTWSSFACAHTRISDTWTKSRKVFSLHKLYLYYNANVMYMCSCWCCCRCYLFVVCVFFSLLPHI